MIEEWRHFRITLKNFWRPSDEVEKQETEIYRSKNVFIFLCINFLISGDRHDLFRFLPQFDEPHWCNIIHTTLRRTLFLKKRKRIRISETTAECVTVYFPSRPLLGEISGADWRLSLLPEQHRAPYLLPDTNSTHCLTRSYRHW